jgi:hypothetical protein
MSAEYDGPQIVGIDLHRRRSVIVRMDEAGNRLDTVRIDNDPMALAEQITKAGEHPQVVLEATYGWYWAADVLQDAGAEVGRVQRCLVQPLPAGYAAVALGAHGRFRPPAKQLKPAT